MMVSSPGHETSVGRIEFVEFRNVGQDFMIGRHPINFHNLGTTHNSYVRGNSIWQSYNRGIAIEGVHNLRINDNVLYDIVGHAVFLKDGVETRNKIKENLVVSVKRSLGMLYSD